MLRPLIDDLRSRAPLERGLPEMERLLGGAASRWQPNGGLLSRPRAYTRICAYRDDVFEVLLLNWAAGATSAVHDHGGQHCWMLVLSGHLTVDDYARLDKGEVPGFAHVEARDSRTLGPGGLDLRSGPMDLHRVTAGRNAPAVSLHVYAAPLRRFMVYDEQMGSCEPAYGTYDGVFSPYTLASR